MDPELAHGFNHFSSLITATFTILPKIPRILSASREGAGEASLVSLDQETQNTLSSCLLGSACGLATFPSRRVALGFRTDARGQLVSAGALGTYVTRLFAGTEKTEAQNI